MKIVNLLSDYCAWYSYPYEHSCLIDEFENGIGSLEGICIYDAKDGNVIRTIPWGEAEPLIDKYQGIAFDRALDFELSYSGSEEEKAQFKERDEKSLEEQRKMFPDLCKALKRILPGIKLYVDGEFYEYDHVLMCPCIDGSIFWNGENDSIGDYTDLDIGEDTIDIFSVINDFPDWYWDQFEENYKGSSWNKEQWNEWWLKGLEYAKEIRKLLPDDIDFYYFRMTDKFWDIDPNDYGTRSLLFDIVDPILIKTEE